MDIKNTVDYTYAGQKYKLNINKFKAVDSLDFIVDLINKLPEAIKIGETDLSRSSLKAYVFAILEVTDYSNIPTSERDLWNALCEINIFNYIFKEAYGNSTKEVRAGLRSQLLGLLTQDNGEAYPQIEMLISDIKELVQMLSDIVDYNYKSFFLIPTIENISPSPTIVVKTMRKGA